MTLATRKAKLSLSLALVGAVVTFALASPAAHAVSYDSNTTIVVLVHGFDPDGYLRNGVFGDDELDPGVLDDVNTLASFLGQPTWQAAPTAPNQVAGTSYYGNQAPAWYTSQDIAEDNAAAPQVPRYALRVAKYIKHVLERAPSATAVNVVSGSFGTDVSRYMIEHDLCQLASTQKIARWNTIVGVTVGNWAASNVPGWLADLFGVDSPDIDHMAYDWITNNVSPNNTMNTALFAPMLITHFCATDDGDGTLTTVVTGSWANDGTNLVKDEYFHGYSTTAALHAATDGTLLMPGTTYQHCQHSDIVDMPGAWAGVAAASHNNKRVTIKVSRLKAFSTGDSWIQGNGEMVFQFSAVSPQAAVLYGCTAPLQDYRWSDGVSPLISIGKGSTKYPNAVMFDQVVPAGETQLNVTFEVWELDNFFNFYKITENPWGDNKSMGSFTVSISTNGNSTVTVGNSYVQADLSTTVRNLY